MNTAWFQDGVSFGLNLDDVVWTTDGAADPFGYDQLQFITREGGQWVPQGDLVNYSDEISTQFGD